MPTLNKLSQTGIKLNYHYSNTLCSASRSSLLTGRYAWRTGVVKIVKPLTLQHTNEEIPFISEILKQSSQNYETAMFGKFHLGYSSKDYLPFNRGFDTTLFFESGAIEYSSHRECNQWFWALKGIQIEPELRTLLMQKFIDGFCSYDLWDEHYHIVDNNVYSEKLFTHNIIKYINDIHSAEKQNPFFIYYAMQTPHWPLETPPKLYEECAGNEREIFCHALLYADEMIGEIVETLKANNMYRNTVVMFMSDNGPNTNWGNKGLGQTLPLRGAKGSTFEGGIRTPALISGGFVQNHCINIGTEYEGIVHISDWFPMIEYIAGIGHKKSNNLQHEIDGINLWPSICENEGQTRESIMHFAMNDVNEIERGFGPSYIRTDKWKLTVNASLRGDGNIAYQYWVNYKSEYTSHPPKVEYSHLVSDTVNAKLYESLCFDTYLDGSDRFDDFSYANVMLFKISEDRIEACNVAKFYPKIVEKLLGQLYSEGNLAQYVRYQIYKTVPSKQGALAQIESYDCETKKMYHLSWNELDSYSNETLTKDVSWNDIFHKYVETVDECNISHSKSNRNRDDQQFMIVLIMSVSVMLSLMFIVRHYLNRSSVQNYTKLASSDRTPLLAVINMRSKTHLVKTQPWLKQFF